MTRPSARRITGVPTPPHEPLDPTRPVLCDQREFAEAFAGVLNRATAAAAADPEGKAPEGSVAGRVQQLFSRLGGDHRQAVRRRAEQLLAGSPEQLRGVFGPDADRVADWSTSERLHPELRDKLKRAVHAHLDGQLTRILDDVGGFLSAQPETVLSVPKTWAEGGSFGGDAGWTWKKIVIGAPVTLQFRWGTDEAGAEHGRWDLYHQLPNGDEIHLGNGLAGSAPSSIWTIDMSQYLPAKPPKNPQKYLVRVTPFTNPGVQPSYVEGMPGKKIPAKPVGPASKPVTITYAAVSGVPEFTGPVPVYTELTCQLDKLTMETDQTEWGTEKFHVKAFVQEVRPLSSQQASTQVKFGKVVSIDPDDQPPSKALNFSHDFPLGFPVSPEWPRTFLVVLSVLEEDDGESVGDWQASMAQLSEELLKPEVDGAIREYLEEKLKEYADKNIQELITLGIDVVSWIAGLVGSTTAFVVAWVAAIAALVIAGIIGGMGDDYYGTQASILVLPTNATEYVHSLPGTADPANGAYKLNRKKLTMYGMTQYPSAAAWDGSVSVGVRWTFRDKADYYGS